MNKYELVIIWESGDKDIYEYDNRQLAEEAESGFRMALAIRYNGRV